MNVFIDSSVGIFAQCRVLAEGHGQVLGNLDFKHRSKSLENVPCRIGWGNPLINYNKIMLIRCTLCYMGMSSLQVEPFKYNLMLSIRPLQSWKKYLYKNVCSLKPDNSTSSISVGEFGLGFGWKTEYVGIQLPVFWRNFSERGSVITALGTLCIPKLIPKEISQIPTWVSMPYRACLPSFLDLWKNPSYFPWTEALEN